MRLSLTPALAALGSATILGAVVWWWVTFGQVTSYGYLSWREAGGCLVRGSEICRLATALCLGAHPRFLIIYWASVFWFGVIILSASLLTAGRTRAVG
jgi:hypothetical protein